MKIIPFLQKLEEKVKKGSETKMERVMILEEIDQRLKTRLGLTRKDLTKSKGHGNDE